ncbi:hypothetical protein BUQ74_11515 [Leptospira weilii serovar Heyan]|nr:hypothetical protein BUQ74_11515 [Leptospira weilii serovar Heyan]
MLDLFKKTTILDSEQFCERFYILQKQSVNFWYHFHDIWYLWSPYIQDFETNQREFGLFIFP